MKSRTIDGVCANLRCLSNSTLSDAIKKDLLSAIELIRVGSPEAALMNLVQARCEVALADEDNRPLVEATEEVALWMIYRAKSLVTLQDVCECLNLWAKTGKLAEAIKERERSLRHIAA